MPIPESPRPNQASEVYVASLLRRGVLTPSTPEPVALALTRILIARGFFASTNGHIDVASKPGTTLKHPTDAVSNLHNALCRWLASVGLTSTIGYIVTGSGKPGTGVGGAGVSVSSTTSDRDANEQEKRHNKELAARLQWDRSRFIEELRGDSDDAALVIDYVIETLMEPESAAKRVSSDSPERTAAVETLILDRTGKTLTHGANRIALRSEERVKFLRIMGEQENNWITGSALLKNFTIVAHPLVKRLRDHLKKHAPAISDLIESDPQQGYRIRPRYCIQVRGGDG